jgi:hypothetical protein
VSGATLRPDPLSSADLSLKLFVEDPSAVRLEELVPVFHRWIGENAIRDELLIDVANYAHVPKGPGVVLVCDKAHYYFEVRGGRPGLRYRGRREARAEGEETIARAFRSVLEAAALLEADPTLGGRYRFRTDEIELTIYDRLRAPSEEATLASVQPSVEAYVTSLYGVDRVGVDMTSGPREPFTIEVATGVSASVEELLGRVSAAAW